MSARSGDFLLINFTLKVKESGETVDTTYDTVAKDAHIHSAESHYGPKFIILGEGWMPKGLEDSLIGLEPGKPKTIELTPEKGYGARDPGKLRLVPLRRFREKGLDPIPGSQVELDGRPAVVRAVGAGRVQVDYNHPLAGRTLVYDVSIERVLEEDPDKINSIIARRVPEVPADKFTFAQHGRDLTIEVPEEAFYLSGIQVAKKAIASDLQNYLPKTRDVSFQETFRNPAAEAPAETIAEQPMTETVKPRKEEIEAEPQAVEESTQPKKTEPRKRGPAPRKKGGSSRRRAMAGSENQR